RRHTSFSRDWSSDVCSSDLGTTLPVTHDQRGRRYPSPTQHDRGLDQQLLPLAVVVQVADVAEGEPVAQTESADELGRALPRLEAVAVDAVRHDVHATRPHATRNDLLTHRIAEHDERRR